MRDLRGAIALGLGIDVAVEERLGRGRAARPEAGAGHFVAISLARDAVGQARHPAGMRRRLAARKAAHGEIEAPHQNCTGLALPAKPARKRANTGIIAASASRSRAAELRSYSRGACVVGERHRAFDLVGHAVEVRRQAVAVEHRDQPVVKRGDAAGIERHLLARSRRSPTSRSRGGRDRESG